MRKREEERICCSRRDTVECAHQRRWRLRASLDTTVYESQIWLALCNHSRRYCGIVFFFFFSSRRRHTRWTGDWSSDVCSSDLEINKRIDEVRGHFAHRDGLEGHFRE